MKRFFCILLFVLIGIASSAQKPDEYNFIIDPEANTVCWQKVYYGVTDIDSVVKSLLNFRTENMNTFDNSVACDLFIKELEYKDLGYTWGNRSIFVRHPMTAHIVVQIKDNRYRVTVNNIECHIERVGTSKLNKTASSNVGDFTPKYRTITENIIDYNYDKMFSKLASSDLNDDW